MKSPLIMAEQDVDLLKSVDVGQDDAQRGLQALGARQLSAQQLQDRVSVPDLSERVLSRLAQGLVVGLLEPLPATVGEVQESQVGAGEQQRGDDQRVETPPVVAEAGVEVRNLALDVVLERGHGSACGGGRFPDVVGRGVRLETRPQAVQRSAQTLGRDLKLRLAAPLWHALWRLVGRCRVVIARRAVADAVQLAAQAL